MGSVRFERTTGESGARCPTGLGHDPFIFYISQYNKNVKEWLHRIVIIGNGQRQR